MLSLVEMKKYYVHMYEELRNYLWDFHTVECLAELEVALYRRFPEIAEIRIKFKRLYDCIADTCYRDEYLNNVVSDFRNIIHSSDTIYSKIVKPKEA